MIRKNPEPVNRARRRALDRARLLPDSSPTSAARREPLLLRVDQVGELLQIGRTHVWEMIWAGELPLVRLGRSVRIPRDRLERWVVERTVERRLTSLPVDGTDVDRIRHG